MKSLTSCPGLFVLMVLLSIVLCGFEGKKLQSVSINGTVQQVDKDFKHIVVNDVKMSIVPHTKIMDDKGNQRKKEDLKLKDNLETEAVRHRDGYHANKIMIKTPKKGR
jgi:hypothetical protein